MEKHIFLRKTIFILLLACSVSAQSQDMKIISFNIRYNSWNNIDGVNGWHNRKAAVARMILDERPAAIGLQEALIDQLLYLDSCLPNYRRLGVGRDDGHEAGEFMAIYYDTSRLELTGTDLWWLSETPEVPSKGWDAACYRTVTKGAFRDRKSGKRFVYFNTHLDHVGKIARAEGVKFLASRVVGDCFDTPVIIGGDMNSTTDDTIFNAIYDAGLQVARDMTRHTSHIDSYNAFGNGKTMLIDHFFVRGVKVKRFVTLNGDYGVPYISDHYPIEMVIKL